MHFPLFSVSPAALFSVSTPFLLSFAFHLSECCSFPFLGEFSVVTRFMWSSSERVCVFVGIRELVFIFFQQWGSTSNTIRFKFLKSGHPESRETLDTNQVTTLPVDFIIYRSSTVIFSLFLAPVTPALFWCFFSGAKFTSSFSFSTSFVTRRITLAGSAFLQFTQSSPCDPQHSSRDSSVDFIISFGICR